MRARVSALAVCVLVLLPAAAGAAGRDRPDRDRRALLVFVPGPAPANGIPVAPDPLLRALERRPGLAVGLMGPTQGRYSPEQALLDITQGARMSPTAYRPPDPPRLGSLVIFGRDHARNVSIPGWSAAVHRAATAPGDIRPGRLASAVPGGTGFVAGDSGRSLDLVAAADRRGRVAEVSLGPIATVALRGRALLRRHPLVVVSLPPPPPAALRALDSLLAARKPGELVIAVQSPPEIDSLQPLPIAVAGPGTGGHGITSDTTRTRGVIAGIDLLPTILRHLGRPIPGAVAGQPIELDERRSAGDLEALRTRYSHIAPRRVRALAGLLTAWALLVAGLAAAGGRAGVRRGLRWGALAFVWAPAVVLLPSALDPRSAIVETAIVVVGAFALAVVTDRLLPWPRGPLAPAAAALAAYTADLAAGTHLINLSLLGPNPRSGARFFGIGNELEPALPILLFVGLAAAYGGRPRSRGMGAAFAGLGAVLAVVVGSGYLGADVGGVFTVSAGAAVAVVVVRPRGVTWGALAVAALVPVAAVALLALLDLVTGASSHFTRSVLKAEGGATFTEVVARRYDFALQALGRGLMPLITLAAVLAVAAGFAYRDRLYGRLPGPAWRGALAGGLAAGIAGALTNDSGPLLFVGAVFALGIVTAYLQGAPLQPAAASGGAPEARRDRDSVAAMQQSAAATDRPEGGRPSATVP
jgi:hypothetical protein